MLCRYNLHLIPLHCPWKLLYLQGVSKKDAYRIISPLIIIKIGCTHTNRACCRVFWSSTMENTLWATEVRSMSQCGITCGAIDEPSRSSKAIDKRVIIIFNGKNIVNARFRNKNDVLYFYEKTSWFVIIFHDMSWFIWQKCHDISWYVIICHDMS